MWLPALLGRQSSIPGHMHSSASSNSIRGTLTRYSFRCIFLNGLALRSDRKNCRLCLRSGKGGESRGDGLRIKALLHSALNSPHSQDRQFGTEITLCKWGEACARNAPAARGWGKSFASRCAGVHAQCSPKTNRTIKHTFPSAIGSPATPSAPTRAP